MGGGPVGFHDFSVMASDAVCVSGIYGRACSGKNLRQIVIVEVRLIGNI